MNQVTGVMKTHLKDRFGWLFLPWIIIMSSFFINLMIGGTIGDEMHTGGLVSIHIYMMVLGIVNLTQSFPFVIGFGVRRQDYLIGTIATMAVIGLASAIVLWALGYIENNLTGGWGIKLHFFHLKYISEGSAVGQIWFQASLMFHLFFTGFMISCIYRRFGRVGIYTFFISLMSVLTVSAYLISYYEKWGQIWDWLIQAGMSATELASVLFLITLVYLLFSHLLLRRTTL